MLLPCAPTIYRQWAKVGTNKASKSSYKKSPLPYSVRPDFGAQQCPPHPNSINSGKRMSASKMKISNLNSRSNSWKIQIENQPIELTHWKKL